MDDSSAVVVTTTFDEFYADEYAAQVRRAFLMLGNRADAVEAVADAFTSVFARWEHIAEPGPYLSRCVLNSCRDTGRRRARREVDELPADIAEPARTSEIELAQLLVALPFKQRAMVVLRFYGGLTEAEIATVLRCRQGSVGPTIHRALTNLRGALQ